MKSLANISQKEIDEYEDDYFELLQKYAKRNPGKGVWKYNGELIKTIEDINKNEFLKIKSKIGNKKFHIIKAYQGDRILIVIGDIIPAKNDAGARFNFKISGISNPFVIDNTYIVAIDND